MTVVVVIFLPLVLAYQTWTYYVFRRRLSRREFLAASTRVTPDGTPPGPEPAAGPEPASGAVAPPEPVPGRATPSSPGS